MNSSNNSNQRHPDAAAAPAAEAALDRPPPLDTSSFNSGQRQQGRDDHHDAAPVAATAIPLTRTRTSRSAATTRSAARSTRSTARSTRTMSAPLGPAATLLTNSRARSARLTMANHIMQAWANASKHSKLVLVLSILFQLAQTALPVTGLAITGGSGYADGCAQLVTLNTGIAIRSFFLAVLLPYLFVMRQTGRAYGAGMTRSPEARIAFEAREVLNWVTAVLFILANFWVFMNPQCPAGSSLVTVTIIWMLITYLVYLTPLFLAVALILCLPCLLVAANHPRLNRVLSRWLHPQMQQGRRGGMTGDGGEAGGAGLNPWNGQVDPTVTRPRGITSQELDKIECCRFAGVVGEESDVDEDEVVQGAAREARSTYNGEEDLSQQPMVQSDNSHLQPPVPTITDVTSASVPIDNESPTSTPPAFPPLMLDADDAQCIICFEDYVLGDTLHVYKCRHHFHLSCSSNWLSLSTLCPLCKQCVVTGQSADTDGAPEVGATEMVELPPSTTSEYAAATASASSSAERVPRAAGAGASAA